MQEKEKNAQLNYISIAKGIGIILVVIGHCVEGSLHNFIYLFHMPFFFSISGYLFKNIENRSTKEYVIKKIKTLYFPFICYNLLFLALHNLFFEIGFYQEGYLNLSKIDTIQDFIREVLGVITLTHMEQVTAPTWYLRVFFIGSILYFVLCKYIKKDLIKNFLCLGMLLSIYTYYYLGAFSSNIIIYGILVCLCIVFMRYGFIYKMMEKKLIKKYHWLGIMMSLACLLILNVFFHINLISMELENPIVLLLTTTFGIYMIICVSKYIEKCKLGELLQFIGNRSLIILVLHCFAFKLVNVVYCIVYDNYDSLKMISNPRNAMWVIIYVLIGLLVPLIVDFIIRKSKLHFKNISKLKVENNE